MTAWYAPRVDAWNHNNYCVPPENLPGICECIEAIFPWSPIVRKADLIGYRLGDDLNRGALYLRPTPAARALYAAVDRLRRTDVGLATALADLDAQDPDLNDHHGVRVATVEEWERRVARAAELSRTRRELQLRVVQVRRPGDPDAPTDYLHQVWVRLGLLGPWRNVMELQALDPGKAAIR